MFGREGGGGGVAEGDGEGGQEGGGAMGRWDFTDGMPGWRYLVTQLVIVLL